VKNYSVLIPVERDAPLRLFCSTLPGACNSLCIWRHEKLALSECSHRFASFYT
jgi:hypothetical protein